MPRCEEIVPYLVVACDAHAHTHTHTHTHTQHVYTHAHNTCTHTHTTRVHMHSHWLRHARDRSLIWMVARDRPGLRVLGLT